ncbi:hypothetical protein BH23GEM6_BH23GEM6_20300 [soil metagenome]
MISLHLLGTVRLALAQAAARSETLVVAAQQAGWQRWVAVLADLATIIIALALIAISLGLIAAAWQSRKIYGKVHSLLARVHTDVQPIIGHATEVASDVRQMGTSVRAELEQLRGALGSTRSRISEATGAAEHRIRRFNALLDVVQEEAEDLFVETAATLRGVRVGARTLREDWDEDRWSRSDPEIDIVAPATRADHETT